MENKTTAKKDSKLLPIFEHKLSAFYKYTGAIFAGISSAAGVLSRYALITAIVLVALELVGVPLSIMVGLVIGSVIALLTIGIAISGFISFIKKINEINQHLAQKKSIVSASKDLNEQISLAAAERQRLVELAGQQSVNISDLIHQPEAADRQNNNTEKTKLSFIAKIKKALKKVAFAIPCWGFIESMISAQGTAVLAVGSLVTATVVITGVTGPLGIAIVASSITAVLLVSLLINKFCFNKPVSKVHRELKVDKLEHELECAKLKTKLLELEQGNYKMSQRLLDLHSDDSSDSHDAGNATRRLVLFAAQRESSECTMLETNTAVRASIN